MNNNYKIFIRYPDATAEDLEAISDITCIICREDMVLPDENDPTAPSKIIYFLISYSINP